MPDTGALLRLVFLVAVTAFLAGTAQAQQAVPGQIPALEGLINPGGDGQLSSSVIQLLLLVSVLSLVPGIAMMVTCLPFMVIVFSFMRQAIGVQQAPPNMMIMALAMFLTFFVMEPVFMSAWQNGITPYMDGGLSEQQAWTLTTDPFREFMMRRTDPEALLTLADAVNRPLTEGQAPSFSLLSTSFMLSEIKHAFQIGFVIFLPFMVIDLVVASVLMAVGMMMVPPTVVSLPFKLGFFVLADGWLKITEAVLRGYGS
ncbi:MAG: flagellar biosynthetic protein FliP [Hyphomonas sp.]|uniref:flagellar type III secretion system pore protein FliP n=1 Tax=Hyphomonas sp. TaxID=87 RepID=UPI0017F07D75|nr:flagellar type III secretion system pore protein FliP [Hyphomonas sp.]MBA3067866.1 flagellar biosynthetic protein FliP [Hyphomonas sp.]MBU3919052.1 flagellar type III secretion system pore protein FliP [Alphaproteobacteria bacterium]MBU4062422.1 flagellar type III secretion system pore protein FliP [Alphaproteobacteria bacterium]MBU4165969.1 flagellar type III secretion system pore protein FliP [Alphaproteobacteria bacterium]